MIISITHYSIIKLLLLWSNNLHVPKEGKKIKKEKGKMEKDSKKEEIELKKSHCYY